MNIAKLLKISVLSLIILGSIMAGSVFAASSTATITIYDASKNGKIIDITDGTSSMYGEHQGGTAKGRGLYIQRYESVPWAPDVKDYSRLMIPYSTFSKYFTGLFSSDYYVRLNPEGPSAAGVQGYGSITD